MKTTPETFIEGARIGGYNDLRRRFGMAVRGKDNVSYQPVFAVFAVAAPLAAVNYSTFGELRLVRSLEWFIAFSMCIPAMLKLQDMNMESFSTMFLNYDLLAARWVPTASLPVRGADGWRPAGRRRAELAADPDCVRRRDHRRGFGGQGRLHRPARHQMRLRRGRQPRPRSASTR